MSKDLLAVFTDLKTILNKFASQNNSVGSKVKSSLILF